MAKRGYSSTDVNRFRPEDLRERVEGRPVVIGVDVAKGRQYASLWTKAPGEPGKRLVGVNFKLEDTRLFIARVGSLSASQVDVVLEPTGSYGEPLIHAFREAGWRVSQVSGKRTHDAREVFDGVPGSHDAKAGDVLARLFLEGVGREIDTKSAQDRDRAASLSSYRRLQDQTQRIYGELEALLARLWPELTSILPLTAASLAALLAEYPGPRAVRSKAEEARDLLARTGGNFLKPEKIDAVLVSAQETLGVPASPGERRLLQTIAAELREVNQRLREAQRELESFSTDAAATLVQAVGKATSVYLMAALGDLGKYACPAALEKAVGLNLRQSSSGTRVGPVSISKRGPSAARQALYFFTLRMIKDDPIVRAYYETKRDGRPTKKAIIAVMRKLVRGLWHVARGAAFDARLLFNVNRLSLAPSASKETTAM